MEAFGQDIRYGVRSLLASPGFALVAVLTLALGIGANTAIFSVVNGVLMRPLPFDQPDELVWVREANNRGGAMNSAWLNVLDWQEESTSVDGIVGFTTGSNTVLGAEEPLRAQITSIGRDFWTVFPVVPQRGRLLDAQDFVDGAAPVAVVSDRFWRNQLASAPIEEIHLEASGQRLSVVGVLPPSFDYPADTEIWNPVVDRSTSRTSHNYSVVARLRDGVSVEQGRQELDALTKRIVLREPDADPDYIATGAEVTPLREALVGDSRSRLLLLLGASALVLLIACTNLASTLLARGTARERELAVRSALGAGKGRIVRQLLTESVLLAAAGAAMGTFTAWVIVRALVAGNAAALPRLGEVGVDATVLGFAAVIALGTAGLFGLLPALRLSQADASLALRSGSRGNASGRGAGTWTLLVATEVALALVLLVGSGLLIRSFRTLLAEDAGFDAADVVSLPVSLSRIKYETADMHALWYGDFIEALETQPGIQRAAVMSTLPVNGGVPNGRMDLDNDPEKHAVGSYVVVSGGVFDALDVPVLKGRTFDERDQLGGEHVAIVSQAFADQYWPGEEALGRTVTGGGMDDLWDQQIYARVVGVVGDVRFRDLGREASPTVYFAYTQRPFRLQYGANVVAEASTAPGAIISGMRSTLQRLEPDVPIRIEPMAERVRRSVADRRFVILILGGFSLTALLLAGVGIYGVVSYTVARRTREVGIRLALGAERGSVLRMVFAGALGMVLIGVVVGAVAAVALSGTVRSLLYGVEPTDPVTFVAVALVLVATAALATWIPAARSTRVDPIVTMRAD